jgi:hypothetical protein
VWFVAALICCLLMLRDAAVRLCSYATCKAYLRKVPPDSVKDELSRWGAPFLAAKRPQHQSQSKPAEEDDGAGWSKS